MWKCHFQPEFSNIHDQLRKQEGDGPQLWVSYYLLCFFFFTSVIVNIWTHNCNKSNGAIISNFKLICFCAVKVKNNLEACTSILGYKIYLAVSFLRAHVSALESLVVLCLCQSHSPSLQLFLPQYIVQALWCYMSVYWVEVA